MARPERLELPTFWFVAVAARKINKLAVICSEWQNAANRRDFAGLVYSVRFSSSLSLVTGWAQNWAQQNLRWES